MSDNGGSNAKKMEFHRVHCPRCGRTMLANELAFDFGEIINVALEKAKNRKFGHNEEWYDLTNLNLCLYLDLRDLMTSYGLSQAPNGTYQGMFTFTTKDLGDQLLRLADSANPNMSIAILGSSNNLIEYEKLTRFMSKSSDVDVMELAERIQELAIRIQKNPNAVIASFHVTVNLQKDDRGNYFANRLLIKFDDGQLQNVTRFICKGEKGAPCGKVLYGHAGQFKEIIIGLAGTARVGKTAYLASLLASILRQGNGIQKLGHDQNVITNIAYVDEAYDRFKKDLLDPYANCTKITKTQYIFDKVGDTEAISLFSLTFAINNRKKYIFTFIDMPGEVYDDGAEGANVVINNRQIISDASMIWLCIAPAQIAGGAVVAGGDQVNTDLGNAFANLEKTMQAINRSRQLPTAVLITCSDLIEDKYELFDSTFNPFASQENPIRTMDSKNKKTPWVSEAGALFYTNMEWFIRNAFSYLKTNPGLPASIENIFGGFTPFAVASYGKQIDNPLAVKAGFDIPTPSMIEGPFLWTLGILGLIPVCKEELVTRTRRVRKGLFGHRDETYQETEIVNVEGRERRRLFYYSGQED